MGAWGFPGTRECVPKQAWMQITFVDKQADLRSACTTADVCFELCLEGQPLCVLKSDSGPPAPSLLLSPLTLGACPPAHPSGETLGGSPGVDCGPSTKICKIFSHPGTNQLSTTERQATQGLVRLKCLSFSQPTSLNSQDKPDFWKPSWILPFLPFVKVALSSLLTTLTTCSPGHYLLITLFYHCYDHLSLFSPLGCIAWGHGPFISITLVPSLQHWVCSVCFYWIHGWVNSLGLNFRASFQIPCFPWKHHSFRYSVAIY